MLTGAERRLLRFLQTAKAAWTPAKVILNTEELLPGDEKVLPSLVRRDLVFKHVSDTAYRLSETGVRALGPTMGNDE